MARVKTRWCRPRYGQRKYNSKGRVELTACRAPRTRAWPTSSRNAGSTRLISYPRDQISGLAALQIIGESCDAFIGRRLLRYTKAYATEEA
jgi:hypothetical protein